MSVTRGAGTLALVGGGEWNDGCRGFDGDLLTASGGREVVVLPSAAAFEHPERVADRASAYFRDLDAKAKPLMVLHRAEAEDHKLAAAVRKARFVYLSDGSPLHLRSVLKDSALFEAMLASYHAGGVLAASGAGATLVCDPMVDPRGGAYTVGLGVISGLAVFPYHGTTAEHLRERSIDLLPTGARLVGIDEQTALVRDPHGVWGVVGVGSVTVYRERDSTRYETGALVPDLEG
ncbi:MAG TPA: Type 1 glutamine amidotransferase-like domain-containing protein [Acidimicrobiia bacterium]|nr:Type 1 glutamine amidotransferase-like domain-containing protein [Acidimicrobiia bacterium]